jgi:hypothetical protein
MDVLEAIELVHGGEYVRIGEGLNDYGVATHHVI